MDVFQRQKIDTSKLPPAIVIKWDQSTLEEGFVPFPKKLLRCLTKIFSNTNGVELLSVVLAVVDFKRANQTLNPSAEYLAYIAGMDVMAFKRNLEELERQDLITVSSGFDERLDIRIDGLLKRIKEEAVI